MAGLIKIKTYPKHYFLGLAAKSSIVLVFLIGLFNILSDIGLINKINHQLPQTKIITSVLLILSSLALWIFQKNTRINRNILKISGVVVLLVSLISLSMCIWGKESSEFYHWRMAFITTSIFIFLGVIFILYGNNSRRQDGIAHVLFFPTVILSYFGLISYILKVYDVFQLGPLNMTPGAAISLFLVCMAILFLKPDTWLMKILSGPGTGSIMGRWLLPWLLILPVVIAWLRIEADLHSFLPSEGMVILTAIVYTLSFLFLVWLSAWLVNRIDQSRRSAEEALRESEARLMALVTATSDVVYRMSPDWSQMYNLRGGDFLTSVERSVDDWLNNYIPEHFQPIVLDAIHKAISTKSKFELEHEVRRADGTIGCTQSSAIPIMNYSGEIVEWYGIASDITERKRATEALERSEKRMRALLCAASNTIYRMDPEWKTILLMSGDLFNPTESFPYRPEEYIPSESRPKVLEAIENAIKTKSMFEMEHPVILPDGTTKWTHSRAIPIFNDKGEIEEWFGFAYDITERKRAVEALKESEQRWITTLASIGEGVIATCMEGKITFMNREAEKLTGWHHHESLGEPLSRIVNILNDQPYDRRVRIKKENMFQYLPHNILLNKSGKEVPVEYKLTPIVTKDGLQKGNVSILRDVSQRERVERLIKNYGRHLEKQVKKRTAELEKTLKRAESADRLKTSFLLNMSHELRTPLNSIIGFSGILLQRLAGPVNTEQEKQLEMVQKSGRHLLSLVNDIIDISKIELGELNPNYETFNFQEMIEEVQKLLQPFADHKGIDIRFIKDTALNEIESDKKRLKQIFINVINNAIKFTEKGSVTVTCRRRDNDFIVTEVSDTGIGIRKEDMGKLFNPFIQLENSFTRKFEGSGLGLSISKRLLDLLHGSITVKSEIRSGSTFTITLPVNRRV